MSSAERRIERRSRWAEMNDKRSAPWTDGGIRVPELERFCTPVDGERELVVGSRDVAAVTAEARRE